MIYKGEINREMAKKYYPVGEVNDTFTVEGIEYPKALLVMTGEDDFGLAVGNRGYIGTKEEMIGLLGEKGFLRLKNEAARHSAYCVRCHKVILQNSDDCYCDECREEGLKEDERNFEQWTYDKEVPNGGGLMALARGVIRDWARQYSKALDDYVENPFSQKAFDRVRSAIDGERFLYSTRFKTYTMGSLDPDYVRERSYQLALERREERIQERIKAACIEESRVLKEEIKALNKELEKYEQQTEGSKGRKRNSKLSS